MLALKLDSSDNPGQAAATDTNWDLTSWALGQRTGSLPDSVVGQFLPACSH